MKKILQNKSLVTIVAMIVCLVILFFGYRYRVKVAIDAVRVPVAKRTINAREGITEDVIDHIDIARSMLTENVITDEKDLLEHYVNYNTIIPEGSLFYKRQVVEWKSMPDSAWKDIPDCSTIVSLPVNVNSTYGNSIYPGDKIDLFYSAYDDKDNLFIGKLIEGIRVLAVKDQNGNHIFSKTANQSTAVALIFSVSDVFKDPETGEVKNLHLLFRNAMYAGGDIIPVPRNVNYDNETTVASKFIENYINSRMTNPDDDEIDAKCAAIVNTITE